MMYSYFAFIKIYFYFSSLLGKSNLNVRMKTLEKKNMLANLKATPSLMPILDLATRGKESGADAGG